MLRREVAPRIKRLYEHSLVRTLKQLSCGHNLARTHFWKYAAQKMLRLRIFESTDAQSGWVAWAHKGREKIMLESCKNAQDRFNGVHKLIDNWLHERRELVKAYEAVRAEQESSNPKRKTQKEFCQVLVDYVSAGHFEIYEQLNREAEAFEDDRGLELAHTIYPRIDVITEAALAFNDLCDGKDHRPDCEKLAEKFVQLGALLHERFELEDCLIEVLHTAHKEKEAAQA